ncbi:MAG TPA: TIGR03118 family protein, partial [Candidatus Methylomirabilis sp.]|nr:TIGR03118 family protein [Candidatus Methylomirabilis sp.]
YDGSGTPQSLVVTIPPPTNGAPPSAPTGQVFNDGSGFPVSGSPALFIFATEDGTISGWSPTLADKTHAVLEVDRSGIGAVYKGVTLNDAKDHLYATNFRFGTIEVFDANWTLVDSFTDPNTPPGYAPFNIQNLNGMLYVTFAKQDDKRHDDVAGPGNGFVDILDPATNTFTRLMSGHPGKAPLNSPWGLALAPASGFGQFSGALLVGNFGDGTINAFDPTTGGLLGHLRRSKGGRVKIDGLWALVFGKGGANNGPTTTLFFTAGPNDESHGLFGKLEADQ